MSPAAYESEEAGWDEFRSAAKHDLRAGGVRVTITPYYRLNPDELDPGSGEQEAAYLLNRIAAEDGLATFLKWGGPDAFEDEGLRFLAIDASEAMKALDEGLTAWAEERGVSR